MIAFSKLEKAMESYLNWFSAMGLLLVAVEVKPQKKKKKKNYEVVAAITDGTELQQRV